MPTEAKKVFGEGRICQDKSCNLRLAIKEEGVEVDGKVYHSQHNPLRKKREPAQLSLFGRLGRQYSREGVIH